MKLLEKTNKYAPAFAVSCLHGNAAHACQACGHVAEYPNASKQTVTVMPGLKHGSDKLSEALDLPTKLQVGTHYSIVRDEGKKLLVVPARAAEAIGGFHVAMDGAILPFSSWDLNFLPKATSPHGMVLVAGLLWKDIYFLNVDPHLHGTSAAAVEIACGSKLAALTDHSRVRKMNYWGAKEVLAMHGKRMLTRAEFAIAARGVEEGKSADSNPEKTLHLPGLRSEWGGEMMIGCKWTWGEDIEEDGFVRLLGGRYDTAASGPLAASDSFASIDYGSVAARGCCDHLILG